MSGFNPIDLLFDGMEKLGPGDNVHTLKVLRLLPMQQFRVIVDVGCGTGRQTLVLAKELGIPIHAIDSYEPFLNDMTRRAQGYGFDDVERMQANLWKSYASGEAGLRNGLAAWP